MGTRIHSSSNEVKRLVLLATSGEEGAFAELVRRFQDLALGYSYSILKDFHTAQDVTQEAFLDTYRLLPKLRRPEAFSGWLRTIVFKHCNRHLRRKRAIAVERDTFRNFTAGESSPPEDLERKDRLKLVKKALDALNQQERTAIVLYYFQRLQLPRDRGVPRSAGKYRQQSYAHRKKKVKRGDLENG